MKSEVSGPFGIKRNHVYLILTLWLGVHVFLFQIFGVRDYFVDSLRYIAMADYLLLHGSLEDSYQFFYAVPIFLLAFFRATFPDGVVAFVLFQSMVSAIAVLALYKSATVVFGSSAAGLCAAIIYLLWVDCIQWNTAVMTESLAASLICMVICLLTHFYDSLKVYALLFVLIFLCVATRPTGVLIAAGTVAFLLARYWPLLVVRPVLKFSLLLVLGAIAFSGAYIMLNQWDFTDQYERGNIVTYMDTIEGEPHYHGELRLDTGDLTKPDPNRSPAEKIVFFALDNPVYFVHAGALKVFYLVSGIRPYFSTVHNLYTVFWLSVVYGLCWLGFRRVTNRPIRNFCMAVVVLNCLLVSVSAVDWDNRFFIPMQPGIVLLAAGGGFYFFDKTTRHLPKASARVWTA